MTLPDTVKKYLSKIINPDQQKTKQQKTNEQKSWNFLSFSQQFQQLRETAGVEAYYNNVIVHRCISLIASSASHVPWLLFKHKNGKREAVTQHPILKLMKKPNPVNSGADFFIDLISGLLLHGNSYVLSSHQLGIAPTELYLLPARHTEVIISQNNEIIAYKYRSANSEKIYPVEPINQMSRILHLKNYHPDNQHYGASSLQAASAAISLYTKTLDWNKALLKNATKPSGALVFQDSNGYLTEDQFSRLKEQFYDNFSGSSNSGKPLILEGGLKWQEMQNAEKFEKFLELKDSSARDIAIAFNVPPQLLGLNGDNTYSNMQEARLALWEENIIPLLDKLSDAFSNWLSYWYKDDLHLDFDRDSISALTEKRENLWAKIAAADFMTINEKRTRVGLSPVKDGDIIVGTSNTE